MTDQIRWDIEVPTLKLALTPDASPAVPQTAAGALVALPTPSRTGAPDLPIPMPKQRRGGDVRNAPFGPVPAVSHLTNVHHPVFAAPYETPEDGDVA